MSDVIQITRLRGTQAEKDASERVLPEGQTAVVLDEAYHVLGDGVTELRNLRPMEDRRVESIDDSAALDMSDVSPSVICADTTADGCVVNLPELANNIGRRIYVINIGAANPIEINADGSDVIGALGLSSISVSAAITTTILIGTPDYWEQVSTGSGGSGDDAAVGTIFPFAGTTAPLGSLACDGSSISRSTYAELFAVIGETWGAGDGSTTFDIPDLRGAFLRGTGTGTINTREKVGPAVGTMVEDAMQGHWHEFFGGSSGSNADAQQATDYIATRNVSAEALRKAAGVTNGTNMVRAPATDGTNGTPRTGTETYPYNAGVLYCIKASRTTSAGVPLTALRYDTGWVSESDWTNNDLAVTHNLGAPLSELIVRVFLSSDGTDDASIEVQSFAYDNASSSNTSAGMTIYQVDENEISIQTGIDGVPYLNTSGARIFLGGASAFYYRVVVYKPEIIARSDPAAVRSIADDYSITGRDDAGTFLLTTGASAKTVTLPAGSLMVPGDEFEIVKADAGAGGVTISPSGSDTIDGAASVALSSQYDYARLKWLGFFWGQRA